MVMFKKIFALACILGVILCIGCAKSGKKKIEETGRIKTLSTIAQIGDVVSEIGGDRVDSFVLVRGELNPHTYELVKGDDEKIQGAVKVFYNGLGLEHGASVSSMIQSHPGACALGESIQHRFPDKILWKDSAPDPHIWMDISLWKEIAMPIADQLTQADPEGATYYRDRAKKLVEKMETTDVEIRDALQAISPEKRFLVTSHDAFHYFARRYLAQNNELDWEKRFAAPEGLSPEGQLNPVDLKKIIDHLRTYHIEVLFPESNVSRDSIRKLVDAGKRIGMHLRICEDVLYGDSFRGTYLEAMKHNAELIARALNESSFSRDGK